MKYIPRECSVMVSTSRGATTKTVGAPFQTTEMAVAGHDGGAHVPFGNRFQPLDVNFWLANPGVKVNSSMPRAS